MSKPTLIKKYGNRRIYHTGVSRYITLDELAGQIQGGAEVRVVDSKTGEDLTRATLAHVFMEARGASRMLPAPLLTQLIRLDDDDLAEFCERFMAAALAVYLEARRDAGATPAYNRFAMMPFVATEALARLWASPHGSGRATEHPPAGPESAAAGGANPGDAPAAAGPARAATSRHPGAAATAGGTAPETAAAAGTPGSSRDDDVAQLRREVDELKRAVRAATAAGAGTDEKPRARRSGARRPGSTSRRTRKPDDA